MLKSPNMIAQGREAASQVFTYGGLATCPLAVCMGKMKEIRPLTQPVRMINESNTLIKETCIKCVRVLKEEHLILPLGTGAVR